MSTLLWVAIALIGLFVLLKWYGAHTWKNRLAAKVASPVAVKSDRGQRSRRTDAMSRYRAVSVRPQLHACLAARTIENVRFLASEAPHFPLPGCDRATCRCQYQYFSDRRDDERRSLYGIARKLLPLTISRDRRSRERRRIAR